MPPPAENLPQPPRKVNVCGLKAVTAAFVRRPKCIQRLFFDAKTAPLTGEMCRWLAQERRIYRQVEPAELERIAGTVHHGGIVAATERPPLHAPKFKDLADWQRAGEPLLILDRIGNPHNLGAIARSAAFFGINRLLIQRHPLQAQPNDAAYRVAEGGLEHVYLYEVNALVPFVKQLRERFLIIGAAVRGGRSLDTAKPPRAPGRPVALLLGNEETGLDSHLASLCELFVRIPGHGAVESLNVSTAAAILLHWVAAGRPSPRPSAEAAKPPVAEPTENETVS
jgi:TrmH RNA methyltransferase